MTKDQYFDWLEHFLEEDINKNGDRIMAYTGSFSVKRSDQLRDIKSRSGHSYDNMLLLQEDFKKRNRKPLWDE